MFFFSYGCTLRGDVFVGVRYDVAYFRSFVELFVLKWSVRPRVRAVQ